MIRGDTILFEKREMNIINGCIFLNIHFIILFENFNEGNKKIILLLKV